MSERLPERPSLEYLRKFAKDRLAQIRRDDPDAKLTVAQLAVAQYYGHSSWRALKAEVDRLQAGTAAVSKAPRGWTELHSAAQAGDLTKVRSLLAAGADPNAREEGDNTTPLHWAAANRHTAIVRALLDAGGDVNGFGDAHELDAIGWATVFHPDGGKAGDRPETAALLIERGARHHIFSALSLGDFDLVRQVVRENPQALDRRMSRFEVNQTPMQFAKRRGRQDLVELLIELGVRPPEATMSLEDFKSKVPQIAQAVYRTNPMIYVPDVAAALAWYVSIGFAEVARYGDESLVNFGVVSFGKAEVLINMHGKAGRQTASLWFYTTKIDQLYQLFKARGLEFVENINDTFYQARQFAIEDLNGYVLYFMQNI
jgi:ankyrin repeat protein